VQKPSIDKLGDRRPIWVKEYDPGSLLPRCRVPIFFVNGTNDVHYVLDSYMKSFDVVPGEKHMRIEVNMRHGHPPGWAPQEIGIFIDSHCDYGRPMPPKPGREDLIAVQPLPVVSAPVIKGDHVEVVCVISNGGFKKAEVHYTSDGGPRSGRQWKSLPAEIKPDGLLASGRSFNVTAKIIAPKPPPEANTWFISITDERDAMVTTPVQFQSEK
jgi:hypothetical protein